MKYSQLEELANILKEEFLLTGNQPDMLVTITKDSMEELDHDIFLRFGTLTTIPTNHVFQKDTRIITMLVQGIKIRLKELET